MGKDLSPVPFPNGKGCLLAKVNVVREVQSASGEELRPLFGRRLMPSLLEKAFKAEL
jgi:hypothetical protein